MFREAPAHLLREDAIPIDGNVEDPTSAFDEFDFESEFGLDVGCQTGSLGKEVSSAAVFDRNLHFEPSHRKRRQRTQRTAYDFAR